MRYSLFMIVPFAFLLMAISVAVSDYEIHKAHVQLEEAMRASHSLAVACFNEGYAYGELHELENETHQRINYNHTPSEGCRK